MNYTYKEVKTAQNKISDNTIQRIEDAAFIPFDPANIDYQAYLAWLAEGNKPLPADELTTEEVT